MKRYSKTFYKCLLVFFFAVLQTGCGFHLRNQHALPINFHCLSVCSPTPYGNFESTLKLTFERLGVKIIRKGVAPVTLHIISTTLTQDVPTIGGSNQAHVYVFYYQVKFEILDAAHRVIVADKSVTTSETLIVNAGTALESTNQVDILIHEMQVEASHMILNILNSPQVLCAYNECNG